MIILTRSTLPTGPAELVFTQGARHMIATSVFLNACAAQGAEGDVTLVFLHPTKKLFRHSLLTRLLSMPKVSTLEANLSLTCRTGQMDIILVLRPNICFAARLRAPAHHFVFIKVLLLFKSLLFLIQVDELVFCQDFL